MRLLIVCCVFFVAKLFCFGTSVSLQGAGSNFADPLYQAAIVTYLSTASSTEGLEITYVGLGSAQGTCRLENFTETCKVSDTVHPHDVDFSASDVILEQSDYDAYDDVQLYPTAAGAVVPVYNLPFLTLILTADLLALIYTMEITSWADSRIIEVNPTLENQLKQMIDPTILVAGRQDSTGTSFIWTSYIASITSVPGFANTIGVSTLPRWVNGTHLVIKEAEMAAFVSQETGALGFIGLYDAQYYKLSMASIQKPDGTVVAPSLTSLSYAEFEFGMSFGNNGDAPEHLTADLLNARAELAWPIASYTYLALRKNYTRFGATCSNRYETVRFWYWYYTSQAAYLLANLYGFVPLSESARKFVVNRLQSDIYCNGRMVFKEQPPAAINLGITPFFFENLQYLMEGAYLATSPESSFRYNFVNQSSFMDSYDIMLLKGPPFQMSTSLPEKDFVNFPFAGISFCFLYNICGPYTPFCQAGAKTMVTLSLTGQLIFKILTGAIHYWNDTQILTLNPHFSMFQEKITVVLSTTMFNELEVLRFAFPSAMSSFVLDPSLANLKVVSSEIDSLLAVMQTPYTITFLHFNSFISSIALLPLSQNPLLVSTVVRPDGTPVYPSISSMASCTMDTYIAATNKFNLLTSKRQDCYPLTINVRFISKRHYFAAVCDKKSAALQNANFLAWLFRRGPLSAAYTSFQMLPLFSLNDEVYAKTKRNLLGITCNGVSVLEKHSNYNYISSWATPFAWAVSASMVLLGACMAVWLYVNRLHKVVRFAQPEFMCLIILGAVLITFTLVPLSLDDQGVQYYSLDGDLNLGIASPKLDSACKVVPWLYLTGFSLEFSALFAKVWRLKKIFLAKHLKRVRLTAFDMAPILSGVILVCWFLCAVWTAVDPLQWTRRAVAFDSSGYMVNSYAHCSSPAFAQFYMVMTAFQFGCVLFGMVLCYQTRNVQEDFVENKWITIVLINMMTTMVLTVLLGFFMRQSPSALFAIEVINALMTGFGVLVVMMVPKIQMLMKSPKVEGPRVVVETPQNNGQRASQCLNTGALRTSPISFSGPLTWSMLSRQLAKVKHGRPFN